MLSSETIAVCEFFGFSQQCGWFDPFFWDVTHGTWRCVTSQKDGYIGAVSAGSHMMQNWTAFEVKLVNGT